MEDNQLEESFYQLSHDRVLNSVERALDRQGAKRRATGRIFALNSLENRVYQIEFEDGFQAVAKFYRPERWEKSQLLAEHLFLEKLKEAEVPVITPLALNSSGTTLDVVDGIYFTVFPWARGRLRDELDQVHFETLGRYLARIHRIGQGLGKISRPQLDVQSFGWDSLDLLMDYDCFETSAIESRYEMLVSQILETIEPFFDDVPFVLTHGDCHLGNTLWEGDSPFFLDFDDCCYAPAVQDIWMIVRGRDAKADKDRETILKSYEAFHTFNHRELNLIEPLRILRIIHYSAWIAKRWEDPAFENIFPDFGSAQYWVSEMTELQKAFDKVTEG